MKFLLLFFTLILCYGCRVSDIISVKKEELKSLNNELNSVDLKDWHHKDIVKDSIPGISLDRAYQELIKKKKGKEIIVAVIDTQLDIKHQDLKQSIWINKGEIPNNNIDDDKNGYIDDVNGWNFIGLNKDSTIVTQNYDFIRILNQKEINNKSNLFKDAEKEYLKHLKLIKDDKEYIEFLINTHPKSKTALKKIFPKEDYTVTQLDSLYLIKSKDSILSKLIYFMSDYKKYNLSKKWINNYKKNIARKEKVLDKNFDGRSVIGDNLLDLNDRNYGNNDVSKYSNLFVHGTWTSGLIPLKRENNSLNNIKIMPISVFCYGDEHDKDVALAIHYAVDNGAKIINFSSSKKFSLHNDWVNSALDYAMSNDVLFITSSGNENLNIDKMVNYPNDNKLNVLNNFIVVSSSSNKVNQNLASYFSNYGQNNVDVFAPGENIYTTIPSNKYAFNSGTSLSVPITSKIAALIWSYYPKLKVHQVKEIILASGVSYDIDVEITGEDGKKKLVPFKSLSKSGKIVNAYNALLYAKNYKKWKAGKWPKK